MDHAGCVVSKYVNGGNYDFRARCDGHRGAAACEVSTDDGWEVSLDVVLYEKPFGDLSSIGSDPDFAVAVNGSTYAGVDHERLMGSGLSAVCFPTFRTHLCLEHSELSDHEVAIHSQRQF